MPRLDDLFAAAKAAQAMAYAPYSRFKVGSAIATPDGRIFSGCNVENAAYPVGAGADRVGRVLDIAAGIDGAVIAEQGRADLETRIGRVGSRLDRRGGGEEGVEIGLVRHGDPRQRSLT